MWAVRSAAAVAVRPQLWVTAIRQLFVLARPGWWRTAPFVPVPDAPYLRFRLQTMYGGTGSPSDIASVARPADVVTYLEWCRAWPTAAAHR